jgi:hypothetical protein
MKFRWTIKELNEKSDDEILRALVVERQSTLNGYAPLYKRLAEIYDKLDVRIDKKRK